METKTFWDASFELSAALFKTFAAIDKLASNEVGYCFSKNSNIASKLNKHEKSISRDISLLIKSGYLFSIEIKKGSVVVERRLYSAENYKSYCEDLENIDNLIPTTYFFVENIPYYSNERYLNGKLREQRPVIEGSEIYPINVTGNKSVTGTGNNSVTGTGNKSVTENIYNINLSNIKEREKENESQKSESEEKKANETSNPGAYYQTVRMLLACFPSIVPETVSKLGKPIERIKEVIAFAKKYNKGEGWIFSAIKYDYSLDSSYFDRQAEKKEKIQAWKDKKTEEEKKWEEKLFDFV